MIYADKKNDKTEDLKKILKFLLAFVGVSILGYFVFSLLVRPSLDRTWNLDQQIMPEAIFSPDGN